MAGLAGAAALKINQNSVVAATAPAQLLKAVVTLNGVRYEFREEQGKDLGDFVSTIGGFTQACIRTDVVGCPLAVFFRPDRNSDRAEVVFELGKCFSATPANLGAYSVTIHRGTSVLATIDVPAHYWFSRWRWQSAVRPIVGDINALITQNLLPPFDRAGALTSGTSSSISTSTTTGCTTAPTPIPDATFDPLPATELKVVPYTIMGLAGILPYMPTSGERPDIGIVTEAQAEYICTSRTTAHDLMRAQAEAAGTMPWHYRDENTNTPFDLKKYPGATWYSSTSMGQPYVKTVKSPVTVDTAHQPALAYVPYLLTGDPYHLEDMQFQATWNFGSQTASYRLHSMQARIFAWNLRTLAQCARITPATVPTWLLPKAYWATWLTEYRQHFETQYVNNPRADRAIFRAIRDVDTSRDEGIKAPGGCWVDPWQDDFAATVMGWVIAMGFPDWQRAFDWKIGSTVARTSRTSGWKRAHASPYQVILRATKTSPFATSWAECWSITQAARSMTYTDPDTWVDNDMTYLTYARGALVYVDKLKSWDVAEQLTWATAQLNNRKYRTDFKWRLGNGLV
jgi:hypothetical protein